MTIKEQVITIKNSDDVLYYSFKRSTDIILAVLVGVILLIPMLLVGLMVKLTSRGPVFFKQTRVGFKGREFEIVKFRSMVDNAEDLLANLKDKNEAAGPCFKMKDDPRVTKVGRFIRRTGLDEIPQLWNVLSGDMSFVGPRPALPSEVKQYKHWHNERLNTIPGITCYWQISNRNMTFDEWVSSDVYYINNKSLWTDFVIMIKTIPVFWKGHGVEKN